MTKNKLLSPETLTQWVRDIFLAIGVAEASADAVANSLVDADVRGVGTHGVVRVPLYVKRLQLGLSNRNPQATWTATGAAAGTLDCDNGLGQWAGLTAMMHACDLAAESGVGMVLATNSNHFGTAGWFARKANARGFAALVWSQSESLVVPFGGSKRFFGTNPFCMSLPRAAHPPITLDMATSAVPFGKIEVAKLNGEAIPSDWAVDADGHPTTDPHKVYALQPMAGPKGSGLAMMADLMSGGIAGVRCGPRIHRMYDDFEHAHELVHTFLAFRADGFSANASKTVEQMVSDLREIPPSPGFDKVMLPGEMEDSKEAAAQANGVSLTRSLVDTLSKLGTEHGTPFPL